MKLLQEARVFMERCVDQETRDMLYALTESLDRTKSDLRELQDQQSRTARLVRDKIKKLKKTETERDEFLALIRDTYNALEDEYHPAFGSEPYDEREAELVKRMSAAIDKLEAHDDAR